FNRVLKKNIPLVFFDRRITMNGVSSVTINDYEGGYLATKHLIEQGCKRIAHFSGDRSIEIFKERFLGYKQALLDSGIDLNGAYVIQTKSNRDDGARAIKQLLELNPPPEALFSSSDFAALGAIQELKSQGIKIPEEFSVIGFANEPFTKFMELSITTVDQSPVEMGKMAAKVFLEQVNNSNNVKIEKKVVLVPELIVRKSSLKNATSKGNLKKVST
ncbi:MAG TPA: substrate-binding domain-containing protein, partial [Flavobacteriaceae bacterium]|nr:substrate-binding domain-containing protein [Flavobacteriaceae bacterium]